MILFLVAAVLAFPLGWRIKLRAEVLQGIADLRERGMPVTLEELAAWDTTPELPEAHAVLKAALLAYREMELNDFKSLPKLQGTEPRLLEVPFAAETLHALKKRVEGNEAMLARLREVSAFPRYRLIQRIDPENAYGLTGLEKPFEVLFAQTCVLAEAGQGDAALETISIGVKVARLTRATPLNHLFNVATKLENDLLTAVFPVLVRAKVSDEALENLLKLAQDPTWMDDLQRSIAGSRCLALNSLAAANFAEEPFESLIGEYDRHALWILKFADEVPDMVMLPFTAWDAHLKEKGIIPAFGYPFWWGAPPAETLDPVVLAVLRYRQAHGTLPESLEGLVPEFLKEIPVDGVTGEPLTLVQSATSFSVCGFGQKGTSPVPCKEFHFKH